MKNMSKTILSLLIKLNMTMENALFLTEYVKEFQNDALWDTLKLELELIFCWLYSMRH